MFLFVPGQSSMQCILIPWYLLTFKFAIGTHLNVPESIPVLIWRKKRCKIVRRNLLTKLTLTRTQTQYILYSRILGTCWCLHLWCKIKFRNITSERIEDAHYNSQAGPSNANGWTRIGNSFLRALRCWNSGRNSAQIYLKLQAETRCQPTARRMGKRGGRCTNSQRRLVGGAHGLKMRQPPGTDGIPAEEEESMKIATLPKWQND